MSATQERDQAARVARTDIAAALRIARNIRDPWFRCQALAHGAWHETDQKPFFGPLTESLESGWSINNPNRAVTAIAWPVAALARRSFPGPDAKGRTNRVLRTVIARLARVVTEDPSPVSRADALLLHVHALSPTWSELRGTVLGLLLKECRDPANRKRDRQLEEAALVIADDDPATALALTSSLDESRRCRTIARIEARSEGLGPRPFFETKGTPL